MATRDLSATARSRRSFFRKVLADWLLDSSSHDASEGSMNAPLKNVHFQTDSQSLLRKRALDSGQRGELKMSVEGREDSQNKYPKKVSTCTHLPKEARLG